MDAGALANVLRRPTAAADNTTQQRVSLSVRLAITVADRLGEGALVRELQALAGRYPTIRLVQAPGAAARLQAGSVRLPISIDLRDALLRALRTPAATAAASRIDTAGASPAAAAASRTAAAHDAAAPALRPPAGTTKDAASTLNAARSQVAARTAVVISASAPQTIAAALPAPAIPAARAAPALWPAAVLAALSVPAKSRGAAIGPAPAPLELPLTAPLFDESVDATQAAVRLHEATRSSGAFFEAQLARLVAQEPDPAPREAVHVPAELSLSDRTAAQIDILRRDAAVLAFVPWQGQKARLEVGCEQVDADGTATGADGAPAFSAVLALDLPHLGALTVRLRLINSTLAARIEASTDEPWHSALPELAAQLQARGLLAAALISTADTQGDRHATGA